MHVSQCFHAINVFQILYKGHGLLEWHKNYKGLQSFNIFECHKLFKHFHQPSHVNIQIVISYVSKCSNIQTMWHVTFYPLWV